MNRPWKDVSQDFPVPIQDDLNFQQPTLWPGPEDYETHGGEDVGIYAIGTYICNFNAFTNLSKLCRIWCKID